MRQKRGMVSRIRSRYATMQKTLEAFLEMKLGWLLPLVLLIMALSVLTAMLSALGPLAPFVYPLI